MLQNWHYVGQTCGYNVIKIQGNSAHPTPTPTTGKVVLYAYAYNVNIINAPNINMFKKYLKKLMLSYAYEADGEGGVFSAPIVFYNALFG